MWQRRPTQRAATVLEVVACSSGFRGSSCFRQSSHISPMKLDVAVFAAYGWKSDLSDEEILEKLLALNLERGK